MHLRKLGLFVLMSSSLAFAKPSRRELVTAIVEQNNIPFIEAGKLKEIYSADVVFQDPLKRVEGYENVAKYLEETFNLLDFHSKVEQIVEEGDTFVVFWKAESQLKAGPFPIGAPFTYEGLSRLTFNANDEIVAHRDYFDQFVLYRVIPGFDAKVGQMLNEYIGSQLPAPLPVP